MTSKLDSVRKSLFHEFDSVSDDDTSPVKFYYTKKTPTHSTVSIKSTNAFILCGLLAAIAIVTFTGKLTQLQAANDMWPKDLWQSSSSHPELHLPLLLGAMMTIFTMLIIYFDSEVPGIHPPTPFSPRKANQSRFVEKEKNCYLSYLISIASGVVTFFLLYLNTN